MPYLGGVGRREGGSYRTESARVVLSLILAVKGVSRYARSDEVGYVF